MADLITLEGIMKYAGVQKAIFSEGTIITPSARDWAREHNIIISQREFNKKDTRESQNSAIMGLDGEAEAFGREDLLNKTVAAVLTEYGKKGVHFSKAEITDVVEKCLLKLGFLVEDK